MQEMTAYQAWNKPIKYLITNMQWAMTNSGPSKGPFERVQ